MKKYILVICTTFMLTFGAYAQQSPMIINNLRERVPEMPTTYPTEIQVHTERTEAPIPPKPPTTITNPPAPPSGDDDDRCVFFVPGFGGDQSKWSRAAEASEKGDDDDFPARHIQSVVYDYAENTTLFWAASNLADQIKNNAGVIDQTDEERLKNFLVGHSQGGVVSKYLVYQDHCNANNNPQAQGYYGGIVTVSSSLNGAQIINNREAGMIHQLANKVCDVADDLLKASIPDIILALANLSEDGDLTVGEKKLCDILASTNPDDGSLLNLAFNSLTEPISLEYQVGAAPIAISNNCDAPDIAKVAFYGVEPYTPIPGTMFNNPIFYRTIQHFFSDVNSDGFWTANNDSDMAVEADTRAKEAFVEFQTETNKAIQLMIAMQESPLNVSLFPAYITATKKAAAQLKLYKLYHDINDDWMAIIGATVIDEQQYVTGGDAGTVCKCYLVDDDVVFDEYENETQEECDNHFGYTYCELETGLPMTEPVNTVSFMNKPSDGVVLAESAMYMTGTDAKIAESVPRQGQTDTGSSHMQARNDRNLENMLFKLYEGDFGEFFETERRQ